MPGSGPGLALLRKMPPENWRVVLETNLFSVYNLCRHLVDGMVQRGYGRIINIASINGDKGQFGQTNYSAAKAGLHGGRVIAEGTPKQVKLNKNSLTGAYLSGRESISPPKKVRAGNGLSLTVQGAR